MMIVGPTWSYHSRYLQDYFDLVPDADGRQHLRNDYAPPPAESAQRAVCGALAPGGALPFHQSRHHKGMPARAENPPAIDLFASWTAGTVCRPCLMNEEERAIAHWHALGGTHPADSLPGPADAPQHTDPPSHAEPTRPGPDRLSSFRRARRRRRP